MSELEENRALYEWTSADGMAYIVQQDGLIALKDQRYGGFDGNIGPEILRLARRVRELEAQPRIEWNFDLDAAPEGERLLAACKNGIILAMWAPADSGPWYSPEKGHDLDEDSILAWAPWPSPPEAPGV
jgi:hypothetical protein